MLSPEPRTLISLIILSSILLSHFADGQFDEEWCVADVQTPDDILLGAMDWACNNGADCGPIRPDQPCYLPNTMADHASFAFNSYYLNMKSKGADCYFNAAAIITSSDPSHGACKFGASHE
ncbi:hypothetical protein DCAR_0102311 [Daucus carota subsp. sativus]|uniref:Uncharacterized protein n=1 Tax=Daucus carota subsp. sativus TaxID=79200 RepID=A0A162AIG1_DAUCS|nr:PREDICTED: glucan endo-1,3-beta-glucosidase 4-like [Daucus carota subsp. sativus]WOG83137.1 hypothetical protein DCAR_0102311 [Daucus carota subsp. sativus]